MTGPRVSPGALRQSLDQARTAHKAAARRVAILEKRLGISGLPPEQLVELIADLYGDTADVTARRRTLLLQDTHAMHPRRTT